MARLRAQMTVMLLCLVTGAAGLADEQFRCGGKLIAPGMTRTEVLGLCGTPTSKAVDVQDVRSGTRVVGKTQVERWTYASYSASRVLVFDQDTLKAIE